MLAVLVLFGKMTNAKSGSGKGNSPGRVVSQDSGQQRDFPCSACSLPVKDDGVGGIFCDRCKFWCHGTPSCTKLPKDFIKVFMKLDSEANRGLAFYCSRCRNLDDAPNVNNLSSTGELHQAFLNISESIKDLVRDVAGIKADHNNSIAALSDEIRSLRSELSRVTSRSHLDRDDPGVRDLVREEIREMNEREKRKSSIIIRGIAFCDNFSAEFNSIVSSIWPSSELINLRNVYPIKPNLVRAVIDSDNIRRELLSRCKNLKNSPHSGVFISRDLTSAQRQDLIRRRNDRNTTRQLSNTVGLVEDLAGGSSPRVVELARGFEGANSLSGSVTPSGRPGPSLGPTRGGAVPKNLRSANFRSRLER